MSGGIIRSWRSRLRFGALQRVACMAGIEMTRTARLYIGTEAILVAFSGTSNRADVFSAFIYDEDGFDCH